MSDAIHCSVRSQREVPGGRRVTLDFRKNGERVPAVLLLPEAPSPVPASLLLHGLSLDKERMADMAGVALLKRGIASLALDLPLHGERGGNRNPASPGNPFEMVARWRSALDESALAISYLAGRPDVNRSRISVVGYSLGAFIGLKVASGNPHVSSVVLASGGDLPEYVPFIGFVRAVADPIKMARNLKGRPLLMLHGRYDRAVTPAQAERLFNAAPGPKQLLWWDCGHVLPPQAIDQAAAWLSGLGDIRTWLQ